MEKNVCYQVNIEKPNSESKAENSDSPERLNTVTGIDNTPKKIGENDTLALEATEAVEPKVEEGERDIEDKSTNIIKKDEPS